MPTFTPQQIAATVTGAEFQELYFRTSGVPRSPTPLYTIHDFKKVAALVYLMSGPETPNNEIITNLLETVEDDRGHWSLRFTRNEETQAIFGCNISNLGASLSRATEIIRLFFPANEPGQYCTVSVSFQRNAQFGRNSTFAEARIKIANCSNILAVLDETVHTRRNNFVLASRNRDQPMPASAPRREIQGIEFDSSATLVNESQDRALASAHQRELSTLLRSNESNRNIELPERYELSNTNVEHFLENCREFHPGNRYNSVVGPARRQYVTFGTRKLTELAVRKNYEFFRAVRASEIPTVSELTAQNAREVATYTSYKHGFSFKNELGQRCFAIKLSRAKVEEYFRVGNSGQNRNRTRFPQETRQAVREANLLTEACQMTIATFKVRALDQNINARQGDTNESYRLFVLVNVPQHGMAFTIGENSFFPRVVSTNRRIVPDFFKDPLLGKPPGISNIFKFLMGMEPEVPQAPSISEIVADLAAVELAAVEAENQVHQAELDENIAHAIRERTIEMMMREQAVSDLSSARVPTPMPDPRRIGIRIPDMYNQTYQAAAAREAIQWYGSGRTRNQT